MYIPVGLKTQYTVCSHGKVCPSVHRTSVHDRSNCTLQTAMCPYQYLLPISQSRLGSSNTQFGPFLLLAPWRTVRRASMRLLLNEFTRDAGRRKTLVEQVALLQLTRSTIVLAIYVTETQATCRADLYGPKRERSSKGCKPGRR